jgi:hypothetical protein
VIKALTPGCRFSGRAVKGSCGIGLGSRKDRLLVIGLVTSVLVNVVLAITFVLTMPWTALMGKFFFNFVNLRKK